MQPNVTIDVTEARPVKLEALLQHKTQIGEVDKFLERMKSRHTKDSTDEDPRYEEKFRIVKYVLIFCALKREQSVDAKLQSNDLTRYEYRLRRRRLHQ